jgi:crotonobetainyl-CoA:carnitine CoA-transferase CaiB-like acyl-CoA transferase
LNVQPKRSERLIVAAPLSGIQVVEVGTYVAAPAAGALLADLGAEVIKVEAVGGEIIRHTRPRYNGFRSDYPGSPQFEMDNRGKRSLELDLNDAESLNALLRILDDADVFLTNMLPGRRSKFGINSKTLLARNPRLIYAALSGYGGHGPEADTPAFDYAAQWARSGLMDVTHDPSAIPTLQRPGVGDHAASLSLVCGVLAALRSRDADGKGQEIDVSLLQTGLYLLGNDLSQVLVTGLPAPRHDRSAPRNPLWNHYRTSDDRWLLLVMIESPPYWRPFLTAIERLELEADPKFLGPVERYRNSRDLVSILDGVFEAKTLDEWRAIFENYRIIWAPVRTMVETMADPQIEAMQYFRQVQHPVLGEFTTMGPPLIMSGHTMPADQPAPDLGADSAQVLREAGLEASEVERIVERNRTKKSKS